MVLFVVISKPGNVFGPFESEQQALDWMAQYNLKGMGWVVKPILPIGLL